MLSASRRQPRLLHVSAVDRRQTWSMLAADRPSTFSCMIRKAGLMARKSSPVS